MKFILPEVSVLFVVDFFLRTEAKPILVNQSAGSATTTRYWDCSGGACGCAYLPSGPGTEAHCHSNAMFAAPSNNQYGATYYGTAAVSQELFGYNTQWLGEGCGTCYKLTGTSNIPGTAVVETTLVLKAANLCPPQNPMCSGNKVHFDIAAPGFDVTQSSFAHTCPSREPANAEGFSACESWMINSNDPTENCDCSKFNSPVLEAGCNNFLSIKWNNPTVTYEAVSCPMELDRLNCWEENGNKYPFGVPDFCESNVADGSTPTTPATSPPTDHPTKSPTKTPTKTPTYHPTKSPTKTPTKTPTFHPMKSPTKNPTKTPTFHPTKSPTKNPTKTPDTTAPFSTPTSSDICVPLASSCQCRVNKKGKQTGKYVKCVKKKLQNTECNLSDTLALMNCPDNSTTADFCVSLTSRCKCRVNKKGKLTGKYVKCVKQKVKNTVCNLSETLALANCPLSH
jgi:hypothetical protein